MDEYKFGANILENLTTGMYRNPLVLFREYIQNACDSIDKAAQLGILESKKNGTIDIWLHEKERYIEIEDNGTGIPESEFERVLGNIADSDKTLGEEKGFRGIGRLCGLAYCKRLEFRSKAAGETTVSILSCDAEKMKTLLAEHQCKLKKHLASEILKEIYSFTTEKDYEVSKHYFRVVLHSIDLQNNDLLNIPLIKEYLSFVAPVPYQNAFIFRNEIYKKAECLGISIDEYALKINGEDIFKKYVTVLKDKNNQKYDEVSGVAFKEFYDNNKKLIAWMWVGVYQFKQAIPKINLMRGLRLRKENIQIGDEDALQKLFKEDRGNSYFIGEVFALDNDLIPNSQRDYFNQNVARETFENTLKLYFNDDLYKTYYNASAMNSGYKKIEKFENLQAEYRETEKVGFAGTDHKKKKTVELSQAEEEAKKAELDIKKKIEKVSPETPLFNQVAQIIQKKRAERTEDVQRKSFPAQIGITSIPPNDNGYNNGSNKTAWRVDKLSRLSKQERKLVGRIFDVIFTAIDSDTAEKIVTKIEDSLR